MRTRTSVITRIAAWVVLAMIGITVTVMAVQGLVVEADMRSVLVEQQSALVHRAAEDLDEKLKLRREALVTGASTFNKEVLHDPARVRETLSQRKVLLTLFDSLFIADASGNIVYDVPDLGRPGVNVSERDYFRDAMTTGEPSTSAPITGKVSKKPQINMSAPIFDHEHRPIGILTGSFYLDRPNILGQLRNMRIGSAGRFYLTTRDDSPVYIMHPDLKQVLQPVPLQYGLLASAAGVPGTEGVYQMRSNTQSDVPSLIAYAPLEAAAWTLTAEFPLDEAYAVIHSNRTRVAILGGMFITAAAMLLWMLLQRLLSPIETMQSNLERAMNSATPGVRLPLEGDREFFELARAFNSLLDTREVAENELRSSRAKLRLVIDNVPAIISYTNRDEVIEFAGGQCLTPLPDPSTMVGQKLSQVLSPQAYIQTKAHIDAVLSGYRARFERIEERDDRKYWFQLDYVPDLRTDGQVAGFFSLVQDVTETRRIQASLSESEQRLRLIADNIPALVSYVNRQGRVMFASGGYRESYGADPASLIGKHVSEVVGAAVWEQTRPHVEAGLSGYRERFERVVERRGRTRVEQVDYVPDMQDDGTVVGLFGLIQDVTETRRMQSSITENEQRIRLIADNVPALICYIDRDGIYRFNNKRYEHWLKRPLERITGRSMREVYGESLFETMAPYFHRALNGERVEFSYEFDSDDGPRHVQGEWIPHWNTAGSVVGVYGITYDVTPLKLAQEKLSVLARSDALTGLPNRREFDEALNIAIERASSDGSGLALLYLDVDYFKKINDTWGHGFGDEVLKEFARRLTALVRKEDVAARIAGDEFGIILEGLHSEDDTVMVARKVVESMRKEFSIGDRQLRLSTSVGIAWNDGSHKTTAKSIIRVADRALYETKAAGRDGYTLALADTGSITTPGRVTGRETIDVAGPLA